MSEEDQEKISLEEKEKYRQRLHLIFNHIENVRNNAIRLCNKLIEDGKFDLARRVAQRACCHDVSKFSGIEFEVLTLPGREHPNFSLAISEHQQNNDHHPEYYIGGIKEMSDAALGEVCCDWLARAQEQGTNLREWINEVATEKYGFSNKSNVYKKIKYFVDLLLDKPMK